MSKQNRKPIYCPDTKETVTSYRKYLSTVHWSIVRAKKLLLNPKCEKCKTPILLNIHHKTYKRLGRELLTDLITLCEDCHCKLHKELKKKKTIARKTKRNSYLIGSKIYKLTPYRLLKLIERNRRNGIHIEPIKLLPATNTYKETSPLISLKCKLGMGQLPTIKPKRSYLAFK